MTKGHEDKSGSVLWVCTIVKIGWRLIASIGRQQSSSLSDVTKNIGIAVKTTRCTWRIRVKYCLVAYYPDWLKPSMFSAFSLGLWGVVPWNRPRLPPFIFSPFHYSYSSTTSFHNAHPLLTLQLWNYKYGCLNVWRKSDFSNLKRRMRLLRWDGGKMIRRRKPIGVGEGTVRCHSVNHEFLTKSPETELRTHRQGPTNMKSNYKYIEYLVVFRQWLTLQFPGRINGE